MSSRFVVALSGVLGLVFLVGCGESKTDADTVTKAQFIRQGDRLCRGVQTKVSGESRTFLQSQGSKGEVSTVAQAHALLKQIYLPAVGEWLEAMKKIDSPPGDDERIGKIYAATEDAIATSGKNPGLFFEIGKDPFKKAKELNKRYGFRICGGF